VAGVNRHAPGCGCCVTTCTNVRIFVEVRNICGAAISGATVTLTPAGGGSSTSCTTVADGTCLVLMPTTGDYLLAVAATGWAGQTRPITRPTCVGGGETFTLDCATARPATLTLTDPAGNAIPLTEIAPGSTTYRGQRAYSAPSCVVDCDPQTAGPGTVTISYEYQACQGLFVTFRMLTVGPSGTASCSYIDDALVAAAECNTGDRLVCDANIDWLLSGITVCPPAANGVLDTAEPAPAATISVPCKNMLLAGGSFNQLLPDGVWSVS
jgi:Carboxypeptidase regulatory-like domain